MNSLEFVFFLTSQWISRSIRNPFDFRDQWRQPMTTGSSIRQSVTFWKLQEPFPKARQKIHPDLLEFFVKITAFTDFIWFYLIEDRIWIEKIRNGTQWNVTNVHVSGHSQRRTLHTRFSSVFETYRKSVRKFFFFLLFFFFRTQIVSYQSIKTLFIEGHT